MTCIILVDDRGMAFFTRDFGGRERNGSSDRGENRVSEGKIKN